MKMLPYAYEQKKKTMRELVYISTCEAMSHNIAHCGVVGTTIVRGAPWFSMVVEWNRYPWPYRCGGISLKDFRAPIDPESARRFASFGFEESSLESNP